MNQSPQAHGEKHSPHVWVVHCKNTGWRANPCHVYDDDQEYLSASESEALVKAAREEALRDAVAYLKSEYEGCQEGTLVSYHIASEILRVWVESGAKAAPAQAMEKKG